MERIKDLTSEYLSNGMTGLEHTTALDRVTQLCSGSLIDRTLGAHEVAAVTTRTLLEWWEENVEGKMAPATGKKYLYSLSAAFKRGVYLGVVEENPCRGVLGFIQSSGTKRSRVERDSNAPQPLSSPEVGRIVKEAGQESPRDLARVLLMLDAGLRHGEAMGLNWNCVHLGLDDYDRQRYLCVCESRSRDTDYIVPTKSGRPRYVFMSRRLQHALMELDNLHDNLVLPGPKQNSWRHGAWKHITQRAKINARPKDLRDTFASHLLSCGVPIETISEYLGHTHIGVTQQHYAQWIKSGTYREPMALECGEVPADFLSRLEA